MSWRCPYDECDGSGLLTDEETNTHYDCRCRPQRVSRIKARQISGVIPKRYRDVSFDRPPVTLIDERPVAAVRRYVRALDSRLEEGRGLLFAGDVGTGKTTLAMLVSKEALLRGHSVAIYRLPTLLNTIRATYEEGSALSYSELFDRLVSVDLLHLDDLGAERTSEWVIEQLYSIVDARYQESRAIVATTNLFDDDDSRLREQITDRTVSRLNEMCERLKLCGPDQRLGGEILALPEPGSAQNVGV